MIMNGHKVKRTFYLHSFRLHILGYEIFSLQTFLINTLVFIFTAIKILYRIS